MVKTKGVGQKRASPVASQSLHGIKGGSVKKNKNPKYKNIPAGKIALINDANVQNKNALPKKNFQKNMNVKNDQNSPRGNAKQLKGNQNSPKRNKKSTNGPQTKRQVNKEMYSKAKKEFKKVNSDSNEEIPDISMNEMIEDEEKSDSEIPDIFGTSLPDESDQDDDDFETDEEEAEDEGEEEDDDIDTNDEEEIAEHKGVKMFMGMNLKAGNQNLKVSEDDDDDDDDNDDDDDDDDDDEDDMDDDDEIDEDVDMNKIQATSLLEDEDDDEEEDDDDGDDDDDDDQDEIESEIEDEDEDDDDEIEDEDENKKSKPDLQALLEKTITDDDDDDDFNEEEEDDDDDDDDIDDDDEDSNEESENDKDEHSEENKIRVTKEKATKASSGKGASTKKDAPAENRREKLSPDEQVEIDKRTIFIDNIDKNTDEKTLRKIFDKFGAIKNLRFRCYVPPYRRLSKKLAAITKQTHPDSTTVVAFINYESQESANKAVSMNGKMIEGNYVNVKNVARSKQTEYDPKKAVFLGNLKHGLDAQGVNAIWELFGKCGEIDSIHLIRDKITGLVKNCGYVNFKSNDAVALALECEGTEIQGYPIRVKPYLKERPKKPSFQKNKRKRFSSNESDGSKLPKKFKNNSQKAIERPAKTNVKKQGKSQRDSATSKETNAMSFQGQKANMRDKKKGSNKFEKKKKAMAGKLTAKSKKAAKV